MLQPPNDKRTTRTGWILLQYPHQIRVGALKRMNCRVRELYAWWLERLTLMDESLLLDFIYRLGQGNSSARLWMLFMRCIRPYVSIGYPRITSLSCYERSPSLQSFRRNKLFCLLVVAALLSLCSLILMTLPMGGVCHFVPEFLGNLFCNRTSWLLSGGYGNSFTPQRLR